MFSFLALCRAWLSVPSSERCFLTACHMLPFNSLDPVLLFLTLIILMLKFVMIHLLIIDLFLEYRLMSARICSVYVK